MSLTNTDTAETLVVQFNPEKVREKLDPVFKELEVMGAAGTVDQYQLTKSLQIEFDLHFDCLVDREWTAAKLDDARRFILSLGYPSAGESVGQSAPPPVLFVWPKLYSIVSRVRAPQFEFTRFASTGAPTLATSKFDLRQIISIRRTSEQVRTQGMR